MRSDLRFTFAAIGGEGFGIIEFHLDEALSETFRLELKLASPAIDFGKAA